MALIIPLHSLEIYGHPSQGQVQTVASSKSDEVIVLMSTIDPAQDISDQIKELTPMPGTMAKSKIIMLELETRSTVVSI